MAIPYVSINELPKINLLNNWIFQSKSDLAASVYIEKLGTRVLKYRSHLFRNSIHGGLGNIHPGHLYASRQRPGVKMRNQAVDQPGDRGFSAAAPAAQKSDRCSGQRGNNGAGNHGGQKPVLCGLKHAVQIGLLCSLAHQVFFKGLPVNPDHHIRGQRIQGKNTKTKRVQF